MSSTSLLKMFWFRFEVIKKHLKRELTGYVALSYILPTTKPLAEKNSQMQYLHDRL